MSPMLAAHSVCLLTTWGNLIRRQNHDEIERADETCNPLCGCTEGSDACGVCKVIASECDECYAERREQDRVD